MSESTAEIKVINEPPQLQLTRLVQKEATSKPPRRVLTLPPFPPLTYTTQFAGMPGSPSSSRRRAALTPSQVLHHASGSFFPPEPHVHEDWIYRTTDTIPEGSNSGSSLSSQDMAVTGVVSTPDTSTSESKSVVSSPPAAPPLYTGPIYARPRAYSHVPSSNASDSSGVYYSSAHRRVPSSPSFRSAAAHPHTYFDRPPSPAFSTSSRYSEPAMGSGLSLSELLTGTPRMSLGEYETDEADHARREEMREERRLAMVERHAAILERREQRRVQSSVHLGWIESSAKGRYHEW